MKNIVLIITAGAVMLSCIQEEYVTVHPAEYEKCKDGSCTYSIQNASKLNVRAQAIRTYVTVESGDLSVFKMEYVSNDDPQIDDDELTEIVYFETDISSIDHFNMDVNEANAYFGMICFCAIGPFFNFSGGTISGEKLLDGRWQIEVDATLDILGAPTRTIKFETIYTHQ